METILELDLDGDLVEAARKYSGIIEIQALVTRALTELVERDSLRRAERGSENNQP